MDFSKGYATPDAASSPSSYQTTKLSQVEIIDLTIDDDEDEAKQQQTPISSTGYVTDLTSNRNEDGESDSDTPVGSSNSMIRKDEAKILTGMFPHVSLAEAVHALRKYGYFEEAADRLTGGCDDENITEEAKSSVKTEDRGVKRYTDDKNIDLPNKKRCLDDPEESDQESEAESDLSRSLKGTFGSISQGDDRDSDDEQPIADPRASTNWVATNFEKTGGVSVRLDDKLLPFKFPKAALKDIHFFTGKIDFDTRDEDDERDELTITIPGVTTENFCLALQWTNLNKNIREVRLDRIKYPTESDRLGALLDFIVANQTLKILGLDESLTDDIRVFLVARSKFNVLKGHHIDTAYTHLPKGHPTRALFAKACAIDYFNFKSPNMSKDIDHVVAMNPSLDKARVNSIYGPQFQFQTQIDKFDDFYFRLLKEQNVILKTRINCSSKSGKTTFVTFTDPLTGDEYRLCKCNSKLKNPVLDPH